MKKLRKRYDRQMLQEERQYGFFWYDWLWKLVRPVLVGLAACVLVAGILLTGWQKLGEKFFFPVDETDQTPVTFVVESGSSLSRVTANLKERGLIRNAAVLRYYMDFQGMSQKVQTGEYTLSRSMSLKEISERLTAGDGNPITMKITIIPGWNVEDIAAYLTRLGVAESEQAVRDMCNDADMFSAYYYIADVLSTGTAARGLPRARYLRNLYQRDAGERNQKAAFAGGDGVRRDLSRPRRGDRHDNGRSDYARFDD